MLGMKITHCYTSAINRLQANLQPNRYTITQWTYEGSGRTGKVQRSNSNAIKEDESHPRSWLRAAKSKKPSVSADLQYIISA